LFEVKEPGKKLLKQFEAKAVPKTVMSYSMKNGATPSNILLERKLGVLERAAA